MWSTDHKAPCYVVFSTPLLLYTYIVDHMYTQFQFALYLLEHNNCVSQGISVHPSLRMTDKATHTHKTTGKICFER